MIDAAGDDPRRMNPLAARQFDDLLAELAQPDSVFGEFGKLGGDAQDIARHGIGVHPQQQVGRTEVEEGERVRLDELAVIDKPAQHRR